MKKDNFSELVKAVVAGENDAIEALPALKEHIKMLESELDIKKAMYKDALTVAIEDAKDYGKNFNYKGYEFTLVNGRAKYDYSNVDAVINAKKLLKAEEAKAKATYNLWKNNVNSVTEDGEVLQTPIVTYSAPYFKIKEVKK